MTYGLQGGYSDLVTRHRGKGEEVAHPLAVLRQPVITSPQDCSKKQGAPSAPMLFSSQHQCPCLFMESKCGCMVSSLFSPQHPPLPTPALTVHTMPSREAQVFAPLMCSKKRQLSHTQQEIPQAGALSLAPSSLPFIYKWAACAVCSEGFFSPCADELLAASGLFY